MKCNAFGEDLLDFVRASSGLRLLGVYLSLRGVENCHADQAAAFVIEDNSVVSDFAVGGTGFLVKVDVERIGLVVIVEPHMSLG